MTTEAALRSELTKAQGEIVNLIEDLQEADHWLEIVNGEFWIATKAYVFARDESERYRVLLADTLRSSPSSDFQNQRIAELEARVDVLQDRLNDFRVWFNQ